MTKMPEYLGKEPNTPRPSKFNAKAGNYKLASGRTEWFDSEKEALLAQEMEDRGIPFRRISTTDTPPVQIVKTQNRYPDFELKTDKGTLLVELKGYLDDKARTKIRETAKYATETGYMFGLVLTGKGNTSNSLRIGALTRPRRQELRLRRQLQRLGVPLGGTLDEVLEYFGINEIYSDTGETIKLNDD